MNRYRFIACGSVLLWFIMADASEWLRGTVKDTSNNPVAGVVLSLEKVDRAVTTDENGAYDFGEIVGVVQSSHRATVSQPFFNKGSVCFRVTGSKQKVRIAIYNLAGKCVKSLLDNHLSPDNYSISMMDIGLSPSAYIVKVQIGKELNVYRMFFEDRKNIQFASISGVSWNRKGGAMTAVKKAGDIDTLYCSKDKYLTQFKGVTDYKTTIDFVLVEKDTFPPVITILSDDTVHCQVNDTVWKKYNNPATWEITVTDNVDPLSDIIINPPTFTSIRPDIPGFERFIYSARDRADNIAEKSRLIVFWDSTVTDEIAPIITVIPETVSLFKDQNFVDTGVTAKDAIDSLVSLDRWIVREFSDPSMWLLEYDPPKFFATATGTFTITYKSMDTHLNIGTATRTITVTE